VPDKKIRVVLGDPQTLNLEGVSAVLKAQKQVAIVATVDDPRKLAETVKKKAPDVVVVDSAMLRKVVGKGINGASRVIQLADSGSPVSATPATKGVVRRTEGVRGLKEAIRKVAKGETYALSEAAAKPKSKLSRRETDIVQLVARGMSNREIAATLGLSEQSIKNLVSRVLKKLGLSNRVQLALAHQ
jgi:two-component system NarL family response regulator